MNRLRDMYVHYVRGRKGIIGLIREVFGNNGNSQPYARVPVTSLTDGSPLYRSRIFSFFFLRRLQLILRMLDSAEPQFALDFGCGPGVNMVHLGKSASEVIGLDISSRLELTKNYVRTYGENFSLIRADGQLLPFRTNSIDTVVCMSVLDHLPNPKKALKEISRISKHGSSVVVGGHKSGLVYTIVSVLLILYTALRYHTFTEVKQEIFHGHNIEFPGILNIIREEFEVEAAKSERLPLTYIVLRLRKVRQDETLARSTLRPQCAHRVMRVAPKC